MKRFPFISRIQEKLASEPVLGAQPAAVAAVADGKDAVARSEADLLLKRIRHTADEFLTLAGSLPSEAGYERARQENALLLGYKLTLTLWRRREEGGNHQVLDLVRTAILRQLQVKAPDVGAQESRMPFSGLRPGSSRHAQSRLEAADSDISASMIRFDAGLPGPLTPFYGDLAPTFGGHCPPDALSDRYGKIVGHLFEGVESALDEGDAGQSRAIARAASGS